MMHEKDRIPDDCPDCDYFHGYTYGEGMPICEYDKNDYEDCPYFQEGRIIMQGNQDSKEMACTIGIDLGDMDTRIIAAFTRTIESRIQSSIDQIVKNRFEEEVEELTEKALKAKVAESVDKLFEEEVSYGNPWSTTETMTRREFLLKTIKNLLDKQFAEKQFTETIAAEAKKQVEKFAVGTKNELNSAIKSTFDQAMQQNLTDNILAVLMSNETYQKLSDSAQRLIANGEGK